MRTYQTGLTTISRMQFGSAVTDPSDVERAARECLESQGEDEFKYFAVNNNGRRSIIRLFPNKPVTRTFGPKGEVKRFNEPLSPKDVACLLPWIKARSSYPPKPEGHPPVVKGLTVLNHRRSFVLVGTWCEHKEEEDE